MAATEGRLLAGCGYTFEQLAAMPITAVNEILAYWLETAPPVNELLAAFMRYKKPESREASPQTAAALKRQFPGGVFRG